MSQPPPLVDSRGKLRTDECAGWWQRFGAYLLDGLIIGILVVVLWCVLALVAWVVDPASLDEVVDALDDGDGDFSDSVWAWFGVGVLSTLAIVFGWEIGWTRSRHMAQPGQIVAGFRVVKVDGLERLTTGRAIGRAASKIIYNLGNLGWIPTLVTAFTIGMSERKQALHDMMAGTACVRTSALARRGIGPGVRDHDAAYRAGTQVASVQARVMGEPPPPAPPGHGPFV